MHTERDNDSHKINAFVLPKVSWQLKWLKGKDLEQLSHFMDLHVTISGNSIDGTAADYYSRLSSAHIHRNDQCCDNERHCSDMLASDQDRVVQAIFAEHRHYAFELPGEEAVLGEDAVVQRFLEKSVPVLSALWATSKQEAARLGTDPSYKLCMWQHVTLESPARFMARVEEYNRP